MYISSFKHCRKFLAQDKAMKLTQGSFSVSVVVALMVVVSAALMVVVDGAL